MNALLVTLCAIVACATAGGIGLLGPATILKPPSASAVITGPISKPALIAAPIAPGLAYGGYEAIAPIAPNFAYGGYEAIAPIAPIAPFAPYAPTAPLAIAAPAASLAVAAPAAPLLGATVITKGGGAIAVSGAGAVVKGPPTVPVTIEGPSGSVYAKGLYGPSLKGVLEPIVAPVAPFAKGYY